MDNILKKNLDDIPDGFKLYTIQSKSKHNPKSKDISDIKTTSISSEIFLILALLLLFNTDNIL